MRIQFNEGDPRAGMVVEIDGNLGNQHIASGAAKKVSDNTDGAPATPSEEENAIRTAVSKSAAKKAVAKKAAK